MCGEITLPTINRDGHILSKLRRESEELHEKVKQAERNGECDAYTLNLYYSAIHVDNMIKDLVRLYQPELANQIEPNIEIPPCYQLK